MNTRERFHAIMNFKPFDRLPLVEWAVWWDETIRRWRTEGLPATAADRYGIYDFLCLEQYKQDWFRPYAPGCPSPPSHGAGILADEAGYDELKRFLFPDVGTVLDKRMWESWAEEQAAGEVVLWFTLEGFFWFPRKLLGIENHLYAFYDRPALMHRMNEELCDWIERLLEELFDVCTPDFMTFAEDMSYNHGPMLSKELFDEFIRPYYDRIVPLLKKRGVWVIVDSDGDVETLAGWLQEAGIDGILPLERRAGNDIERLRRLYPGMRFIGHFDKTVMHEGEEALRREFERLLPVAARGGFIVSCDHQTPPQVSLEDYRLYLRLFREYAEEAGRLSRGEAER